MHFNALHRAKLNTYPKSRALILLPGHLIQYSHRLVTLNHFYLSDYSPATCLSRTGSISTQLLQLGLCSDPSMPHFYLYQYNLCPVVVHCRQCLWSQQLFRGPLFQRFSVVPCCWGRRHLPMPEHVLLQTTWTRECGPACTSHCVLSTWPMLPPTRCLKTESQKSMFLPRWQFGSISLPDFSSLLLVVDHRSLITVITVQHRD